MKQSKLFPNDEKPILVEIPLDIATEIGENIQFLVSEHMQKAEIVGSVRRKKPYTHDIDIMGIATLEQFKNAIKNIRREYKVTYKENGPKIKKIYVEINSHRVQVDLYCATPQNYGLTKIIRTGSAQHNMWLASYAISKGFNIKYSYGLIKDGKVVAGETEEEVFQALGLPVPKPELREVENRSPIWFVDRS